MYQFSEVLWKQYGASIDMLRNAISSCPETLWDNDSKFWYQAYHTLFFLDYYMHPEPTEFHPRAPFTMSEMDPSGLMPDRTYSKEELLAYLEECREKSKKRTLSLTEESAFSPVRTYNKNYSAVEYILQNIRHVQHHTAQLNLLIRQFGEEPPKWVVRAS